MDKYTKIFSWVLVLLMAFVIVGLSWYISYTADKIPLDSGVMVRDSLQREITRRESRIASLQEELKVSKDTIRVLKQNKQSVKEESSSKKENFKTLGKNEKLNFICGGKKYGDTPKRIEAGKDTLNCIDDKHVEEIATTLIDHEILVQVDSINERIIKEQDEAIQKSDSIQIEMALVITDYQKKEKSYEKDLSNANKNTEILRKQVKGYKTLAIVGGTTVVGTLAYLGIRSLIR